jgi:hypothetical protein
MLTISFLWGGGVGRKGGSPRRAPSVMVGAELTPGGALSQSRTSVSFFWSWSNALSNIESYTFCS